MSSCITFNINSLLNHRPLRLPYFNHLCTFPEALPKSLPQRSLSKSQICCAFSPNSDSNFEREEARWLREEQRWLREEQRWLREESRWNAERESLLLQIHSLKLRIEELERQNSATGGSVSETIANISALLQVLKEAELGKKVNRIAESGSSAVPMVVERAKAREQVEEKVVVKEVLHITEGKTRKTLRMGSEGDEVRALQEALLKLGFYCGEEDMEYFSFSGGTERAVKTWQATLGFAEDGIMTEDLLHRLYMEQAETPSSTVKRDYKSENNSTIPKEKANGAAVNSVTEISEIQQRVVNEDGVQNVEVSQHRVFLLGENRWEEPSRLASANKVDRAKKVDVTMCSSCRGEGRLLCTECDGSGEPNVEPQFLEWVDEGAKCPYCEGLGYTICDACEGKTVIPT